MGMSGLKYLDHEMEWASVPSDNTAYDLVDQYAPRIRTRYGVPAGIIVPTTSKPVRLRILGETHVNIYQVSYNSSKG